MKGICFTEPMFQSVIEGRKTQTRRIATEFDDVFFESDNPIKLLLKNGKVIKPRYQVGETVYLKEPYQFVQMPLERTVIYKYGYIGGYNGKWKNKLFMSERYARYFIEITGVRCERLQDISDEDIIKEDVKHKCIIGYTLKSSYADLFNSINGQDTWNNNPYVWVYDFILKK